MFGRKQAEPTSQRLPRIWRGLDRSVSRPAVHRSPIRLRLTRLYAAEREAAPRRPWPIWLKQIILLILFLAALVGLLASPLYTVSAVTVQGNSSLSTDQISQSLPLGHNIWLVSASSVEANLKQQFPLIADVTVFKGLPRSLKVVLVERSAKLVWQSGDQRYLVDEQGIPYVETTNPPATLPLVHDPTNAAVTLGKKVATAGTIQFIAEANQKLANDAHVMVTDISLIGTTFDISLQTKDGWKVLLATDRELEPQLKSLYKILAEKRDLIHEYVDVRVPGFAFVKP